MIPRRTLAFLAAVAAGALLAAGAAAGPRQEPPLPPGWSHAEINVTIRGVPHTKIYDRGTIASITRTSIRLEEKDGSVVTIKVTPRTKIVLNGKKVRLAKLRVGQIATTLRIDGGPAVQVTVVAPKKEKPARGQGNRGGGKGQGGKGKTQERPAQGKGGGPNR